MAQLTRTSPGYDSSVAITLAFAAVLMPVGALAGVLAPDAGRHHAVVIGVWIFKAMLLLHAFVLFVLARKLPPRPGRTPLLRVPAGDSRNVRYEWILLAVMLTVGLALRLYKLGEGLWFDEIQTLVSYVRLPVLSLVSTFDSQNQHMMYALLARGTVLLFGESAWSVRLPAALLGVASLAALYFFAREIVGRIEALLGTAFLTVSYHHVWFSQNARGYTGLLLWTLLATLLLVRILRGQYRNGWLIAGLYALVMALAMFTHVTAMFVLIAHFLVWAALAAWKRRTVDRAGIVVPLTAFLLAGTFTLQLYAFVLPQFLGTLMQPTMEGMRTEWKDPFWLVMETLRGLSAGLPGGWAAVLAAAAVFAAGVVSLWRQDRFVLGIMLLPPILLASVLLGLQHNLWPRFFFFAAGFVVMIAVRGLLAIAEATKRRRAPVLATATLALVILLSAAQVPTAWYPKQDYGAAQRYLQTHQARGDAVVTVDMSSYALNLYRGAHYLTVNSDSELRSVERAHKRTWFLYTFPTRVAAVQPQIWERLNSEYRSAAEFPGTVGGGAIFIKVKP